MVKTRVYCNAQQRIQVLGIADCEKNFIWWKGSLSISTQKPGYAEEMVA